MKRLLATLVLGATALAALGAQAAPINGTFGAAGIGTTSYNGADLNSADTLNVSGDFVVARLNTTYFGNPNDLHGLMSPGNFGKIATPIVITGFTPVTNFLVWSDTTTPVANRFSFDLGTLIRNTLIRAPWTFTAPAPSTTVPRSPATQPPPSASPPSKSAVPRPIPSPGALRPSSTRPRARCHSWPPVCWVWAPRGAAPAPETSPDRARPHPRTQGRFQLRSD